MPGKPARHRMVASRPVTGTVGSFTSRTANPRRPTVVRFPYDSPAYLPGEGTLYVTPLAPPRSSSGSYVDSS